LTDTQDKWKSTLTWKILAVYLLYAHKNIILDAIYISTK